MVGNRLEYPTYVLQAGALPGRNCFLLHASFVKNVCYCAQMVDAARARARYFCQRASATSIRRRAGVVVLPRELGQCAKSDCEGSNLGGTAALLCFSLRTSGNDHSYASALLARSRAHYPSRCEQTRGLASASGEACL